MLQSRRDILKSGAAVTAAAGLLAAGTLTATNDDAKLLEFAEQCRAVAVQTARLRRTFDRAAHRQEKAFYEMKPERWCCHYPYQDGGTWR